MAAHSMFTALGSDDAEEFTIVTLDGAILSSGDSAKEAELAKTAELVKNASTDNHLAQMLIRLLQSA